jgi:hypothetical protein
MQLLRQGGACWLTTIQLWLCGDDAVFCCVEGDGFASGEDGRVESCLPPCIGFIDQFSINVANNIII